MGLLITLPTKLPKILVVGDVMVDTYLFSEVERISPEAPVPIARISEEPVYKLGGAANVAVNIKSLGGECGLLSIIGCDEMGQRFKSILAENSICDHSVEIEDHKTIEKIRVISKGQQLLRIDRENSLPKHRTHLLGVFYEIIDDYDYVIFSDYDKGSLSEIQKMITLSNQKGKMSFVDPKGLSFEKYQGAHLIKPNLAELRLALSIPHNGHPKDLDLLEFLQCNKNRYILLTKSQDGMTLYSSSSKLVDLNSHAKEVYDVTGAGDTVMATLVFMVALGYDMKTSTEMANLAASIVVAKLGAATTSLEEINSALSQA